MSSSGERSIWARLKLRLWRGGGLILAVAAIASSVSLLGWLGRWPGIAAVDPLVYDRQLVTFAPEPKVSDELVIVQIDDLTFREVARNPTYAQTFGAWPYSRNFWARVIEQLHSEGARAIVLDAVMDEPHPDAFGDVALAETVGTLGAPFYLGFSVHSDAEPLPPVVPTNRTPMVIAPAPSPAPVVDAGGAFPFAAFDDPAPPEPGATPEQLARALAFPVRSEGTLVEIPAPNRPISPLVPVVPGFGLIFPEEDPDGKMRRTRFAYSDGKNAYVTLATAVAADLLGAERLELSRGKLKLGERELSINRDGSAWIDYRGPLEERFRFVSLVDVLDDWALKKEGLPTRLPEGLFRDKVAMIAGFAVGTADMRATPFASLAPGVSKHAAELESLLAGRFIVDAPRWVIIALTIALAVLSVSLLTGFRSVALDLLWPVAVVTALFVVGGRLLVDSGVRLSFVAPALAASLASVGAIAFNRLFANQDRERIKEMFSRYLAKSVVDQLVDQEELPRLDGETREITAFFSDIRGFSTFSERFRDDPQGLVRLLNIYLTRVSAVLLEHGACLDKYIGDAVVCIFGAPLKDPEHAVRACRASLAVQAEVQRLRAEFVAKGLPDMYTRIGVNSAVMFVGNVGSEQLFDYTAIGDGMNLAARLEGANKNYDSSIMIGPHTYELAKHAIEARELDRVRVAGKTEPVAVYELLALKGQLTETQQQVVGHYADALALYRQARFTEAAGRLEQALAVDPDDGPSSKLLARCRKYAEHPPPQPFDAVAQLEK